MSMSSAIHVCQDSDVSVHINYERRMQGICIWERFDDYVGFCSHSITTNKSCLTYMNCNSPARHRTDLDALMAHHSSPWAQLKSS